MYEPRLGQGHAGVVPSQPMISEGAAAVTRGVFRNRWRTLMSVDDLIADVVHLVEAELGLAEHTYFIYTSDHGFQLGQFNILMVQHSAPNALMPQCPNAPIHQCPSAPMHQCTNAPVHQCPNAPLPQCPNAPMYQCTKAPIPQCPSAPNAPYRTSGTSTIGTRGYTCSSAAHASSQAR